MSFEGYYQLLCANGHLRGIDCYEYRGYGRSCTCGARFVYEHLIDETNCDGPPRDFDVATPAETARCSMGFDHVTREVTYVIPEQLPSEVK